MQIIPFTYENDEDELLSNAYIAIDSDKNCVVIDPSKDYPGLVNYILKNKLTLKGVLLTHGHFDHMRGVNRLLEAFNSSLYIGFEDEPALKDATLNLSKSCFEYVSIKFPSITLSDRQVLKLLNEDIIVLHTPYHTCGSVCYYFEKSNILFTGDSLFKGSIGRSDFVTSNGKLIKPSLEKIMSLPDNVKVYPGHGPLTTIGFERKTNFFVK